MSTDPSQLASPPKPWARDGTAERPITTIIAAAIAIHPQPSRHMAKFAPLARPVDPLI